MPEEETPQGHQDQPAPDAEGADEVDAADGADAAAAPEEADDTAVTESGESGPEAETSDDDDDGGGGETDTDTGDTDEVTVASEHEAILDRLQSVLGDDVIGAASTHGHLVVRVANSAWHRAAEVAKARLDCEYLSFISAIDWMPRSPAPTEDPDAPSIPPQPGETTFGLTGSSGRFQVLANVASTDDKIDVTFKADVDENDPRVTSWTDLYPGAEWHERECWEMFGIAFDGHPHLRHLYLPSEFEGFPLRKDFPLLSREVKPWPGLVDVELMPEEEEPEKNGAGDGAGTEAEGTETEGAGAEGVETADDTAGGEGVET